MPRGPELLFLTDQADTVIDAHLENPEAVHQLAMNNKAILLGANSQQRQSIWERLTSAAFEC
jgi:hypothetical protein